MAERPTLEAIAADLTVPERLMLLCLASNTDWRVAGVPHATARQMLIEGLINRDATSIGAKYTLTNQGRAVLKVLLGSV
jgi:hypothetical protein